MASQRVWNARVINPGTGAVIDHGTLAWENGVLTDVSEARGDPPEGAIDVGGRVVLPGLIDAHVHLISDLERSPGFGPPPQLHGEDPRPRELGYLLLAQSCAALLEAGITTVRDVGSYDDEAIVIRRAIELGLVRGPTVRTCGRIIAATSPGGKMFGTMYVEADGPWAMRRAVREQLRRGADYVKFMSTGARSVEREDPEPAQLTREEIAALIDEAHRLGLRVAAHAEGLEGARLAIEEGVDTVEHGFSLHREPRLLALMAERGQVLVPTLTTFHDLAERFAPQWLPRLVDQAKRQLEEAYETLGAARDAGVALAMGFDSGPPGANLWELVRMAEGGLGSMGALAAATSGGSAALGLPERGRFAVGAAADIVVVDGDPLEDIRTLLRPQRIWLVIRDGKGVAGQMLARPTLGGEFAGPDEELAPPTGPAAPCCSVCSGA
ncbi:amidohydrolase family protein [Gaiella sp.]|uniref:metal-dependent hydrolase family protein n=1 Tax=Gaiella sp. TaxID=2663207 RepID=UPI00326351A3